MPLHSAPFIARSPSTVNSSATAALMSLEAKECQPISRIR